MKTNINGKQQPTHAQTASTRRPENKDQLDSRDGEEQLGEGGRTTHNKKEKHAEPKKKK